MSGPYVRRSNRTQRPAPTSSRPRVRRARPTSSASWPTCVTAASSRPMSSSARRLRFWPPESYRGGMTQRAVESASSVPAQQLLRGWRSVMFAPVGSGQRRRRGSDGVRLAAAVLILVCCLLVIRYDSRIDRAITQVIHPPPWSITWLVTVVYQAGSVGVVVVLVGLALLARRWEIARDIGLSAAGTAAVCGILIALLGSRGGRPGGIVIDGYYMSFPVLQIALLMAIATAGLPYLARGVQRLIEIFIALVALASAVGGHGLPLNVLGSLAIGWGATAVVRLVFGSPLGLPSADDVRLLLEGVGIRSSDVHPVTRQVWGVAKFEATEIRQADSPGRLGIAVYGRDAADARLLTKAGRFLLYRDSGPSLTITRLQQVEHEAYVTMRAGLADVAVPEVVEAGTAGPSRDALLVYRMPPGTALSDTDAAKITDATLDDLYRQLLTLRRARIAHGAISGDAMLADPAAGTVVLADFRNASEPASPDQLDRDLASAIAATAVVIGAERAADSAARCLEPEMLEGALRQLQKPALDPLLARSLRGRRDLLPEVRGRAAAAASIELPALAEPRRVSWPTLIMIVGTLIGGWALIGVLIDVAGSFDTVIGADWVWIILALVVLIGLVVGLALAVPRLRRLAAEKMRPKLRDIWGNLKVVASSPGKLVQLLGGAFGRDLLVAMALSVSLRAFGDHLRLPILIVVITLAALIGGIAPSPGGMGVVEAGMILGLTAAGVAEADATAAVFIQRLFTSYLPPIWGWLTLVWLRRREYL